MWWNLEENLFPYAFLLCPVIWLSIIDIGVRYYHRVKQGQNRSEKSIVEIKKEQTLF